MRANATLFLSLSDDSARRNGPSYECGADFSSQELQGSRFLRGKTFTELASRAVMIVLCF
jgi:hypothetical protein